MKQKFILIFIALLSLFFLTSCQKAKVAIELEENPTTGYIWTFTQEGDGKVELIKDEFEEHNKDKKVVGSGGIHTFTFKAKEDGVCILRFENIRPWEEVPIERKLFKLEIKDKKFTNL